MASNKKVKGKGIAVTRLHALSVAIWLAVACSGPSRSLGLIYLQGRAVEPVGDSILAMTTEGAGGLVRYDLRTNTVDTIGTEVLVRPLHVQHEGGRWYVSDIGDDGRPVIVVLSWDGGLESRINLAGISSIPHQFAVLPDGRIVVEADDEQLVTLQGDSSTTFALVEVGMRPSLMAGVAGGVLHAVPGAHITLYNEFGNIRWRMEWPWAETAYLTDIARDRQGRIHVIAGVPRDDTFIVYTLGRTDGQVLQWSRPGPYATFTIERNGNFHPDSVENWLE